MVDLLSVIKKEDYGLELCYYLGLDKPGGYSSWEEKPKVAYRISESAIFKEGSNKNYVVNCKKCQSYSRFYQKIYRSNPYYSGPRVFASRPERYCKANPITLLLDTYLGENSTTIWAIPNVRNRSGDCVYE